MWDNAVIEVLTPFKLAYEVRFKLPRKRTWQYEYLACNGSLLLRYADATEVKVAFRITRRYKELQSSYEIISVGGDLYWPIVDPGSDPRESKWNWPVIDPDQHVTAFSFLNRISYGDDRYLAVLHGARLPSAYERRESVSDLNARIDPSDRREELLAKSVLGGSKLLVHNKHMYLLGGEPMYVCQGKGLSHLSSDKLDGIRVVDTHTRWQNTDRGVRSIGSYDHYLLGPRANAGEIFRADELTDAERLVAQHSSGMRQEDDTIEIVNWNEIRTSPLDLHAEASIYSLNFHIRKEISNENVLFDGTTAIRQLEFREGFGWQEGAAAIVAFVNWCERQTIAAGSESYYLYRYAVMEIERLDTHCLQRGVTPISRLDDADDDAIASLAT